MPKAVSPQFSCWQMTRIFKSQEFDVCTGARRNLSGNIGINLALSLYQFNLNCAYFVKAVFKQILDTFMAKV